MGSPTSSARCSNIHAAVVEVAIVVAYQQDQEPRQEERIRRSKNDFDFAFLNEDEVETVEKQVYTTLFLHRFVVAVVAVVVETEMSV
jgi:hypothetical protein